MKKTTFVFDMGGVLLGHTMSDYIRSYVNNDEELFIFFRDIVRSNTWINMDAGLETEKGIELICEETGHVRDEAIRKFVYDFRMEKDPYPEMEAFVYELKQRGYKVYLMSNVGFIYKRFFPLITSISYMDDVWASCERKLIKPDKEAFEDLFNLFNLQPENCFFIDDLEENIKAAANCGMEGFVFKNDVAALRAYVADMEGWQ